MDKKRVFIITASIVAILGIDSAYGQSLDEAPPLFHYLLGFLTFPVAGIFYSSSGWIKKVREALAGSEEKIDYKKMGKTVLIGVLLGFGAYLFSVYNEDDFVNVSTMKLFLMQVGINTSAILFVDKWILGRADSPPTPDTEPNFPDFPPLDELEDLIAHADEDRPVEVPLAKDTPSPPMAPNIAPESTFYLADRASWNKSPKTIGGQRVNKIATQESRRSKRTIHAYHIQNTGIIVYNRSRDGVYFMRIAIRPENMKNFYDTFVAPPLTDDDKAWLSRNDYVLTS